MSEVQKHPKTLPIYFLTEMWQRFCYAGSVQEKCVYSFSIFAGLVIKKLLGEETWGCQFESFCIFDYNFNIIYPKYINY